MNNITVDCQRYLASREWALKKKAVRERSGNICERCHLGRHEQTHHLTYEHLGNEPLEDLQGVCRPCHEFLSGVSDFDPTTVAGGSSVVEKFQDWGRRLPLQVEAYDQFNQAIQTVIKVSPYDVQVQLGQIMLETNRRIYNTRRGPNEFMASPLS